MITFKQFLHEEDLTDKEHDSVEAAAAELIKHCTQFPDVKKPLNRISGDSWLGTVNHKLRTRVPRQRRSSVAQTGEQQDFIFSQPAWAGWPARRMSIFCSTTLEFEVGDVDDNGANLLAIYPFDGVKIAMLDDSDLNAMNILKSTEFKLPIRDLFQVISGGYKIFQGTDAYVSTEEPLEQLDIIKKYFNDNGRFDSEANGNDELADNYADWASGAERRAKALRMAAIAIPEKLTPEDWGAKLITSAELDLPGKTRECWFSGKYLSVPYRYFNEFKAEVKRQKEAK